MELWSVIVVGGIHFQGNENFLVSKTVRLFGRCEPWSFMLELWRQVGELPLFQGIPCAAAFVDLHEIVIRGQFLQMHFDGIVVRLRRILYFLDRDFVAALAGLMMQTQLILFHTSHRKISRPGKNPREGHLIEAAAQDGGNRIRSIAIEYDHRSKTTVAEREAWIYASAH
jgi:hypothetical protein